MYHLASAPLAFLRSRLDDFTIAAICKSWRRGGGATKMTLQASGMELNY